MVQTSPKHLTQSKKTLSRDSLKIYGFGPDFQRWISTPLANTESAINHYGWISQPFQVERGIRQGCPLSPLLFMLGVELLAIKIRASDINGIQMKNNPIRDDLREIMTKIQQLADDTTLYLRDKEDLDIAMTLFQRFSNISGLKMNKNKTEAMWLGRDKIMHTSITI